MNNKFFEMLEDNSGGTSSSRAMMLTWGIGTFVVWAFASIKAAALLAIPETVLIIVLGLASTKVIQRFGEKDSPEKPEEKKKVI